jgi:hypothetical protein
MGAAPAEDSHSRISEIAACIRVLLPIVKGTQRVLARSARCEWVGTSNCLCNPRSVCLTDSGPGGPARSQRLSPAPREHEHLLRLLLAPAS